MVTLVFLCLQNYKQEAKKQRGLIHQLERERDRYGKDATDATHNCLSQVGSSFTS